MAFETACSISAICIKTILKAVNLQTDEIK